MVSQCRKAVSRHCSSQSGSPFFMLINRMVPSSSPGGAESASMSETKPYLYSRLARVSISWSVVGIVLKFEVRNLEASNEGRRTKSEERNEEQKDVAPQGICFE